MTEFIVEKLPAEVLVYDQVQHRAHCLSTSAALVWELCDGRRADDARTLLAGSGSAETLEAILTQLADAGLLRAPERTAFSRRRMIGASTAVAAAAVVSIWSPSVSAAGSVCGTKNNPCCASPPAAKKCTAGNQFCVGNTCTK